MADLDLIARKLGKSCRPATREPDRASAPSYVTLDLLLRYPTLTMLSFLGIGGVVALLLAATLVALIAVATS